MLHQDEEKILPGNPSPLGASFDGRGVNFALYSSHAEKVELCLFRSDHVAGESRIEIRNCTNHIWHIYIPGISPGQLYGYRVYGKYDPQNGKRFNHRKLLVDPYAKAIQGKIIFSDDQYDFAQEAYAQTKRWEINQRDSAMEVPKCIVMEEDFNWEGIGRPEISWSDTVIYETHVKGFTQQCNAIPVSCRGTFKGMADPYIIQYLKDLGVTTVELLPVHHFCHNKFLLEKGLSNYWGYNTIGFFAPHAEYSSSGMNGEQLIEFKEMVKAYHKAGLEIILDVVYNHTGEGDHSGPSIAFRGIDNETYYRLNHRDLSKFVDVTGTGNTLNISNPAVLKMVLDSMRYWAEEMMVDGFRFDLSTALTRGKDNRVMKSAFLDAVYQDPVLSGLKLIAEPWDLGKDGYQLGRFPLPWKEWNDTFRDSVRKYWRGDESQLHPLIHAFTGSEHMYPLNQRGGLTSVNFVTAHDGFTMHDLVSYNQKYNLANGEDNRDGGNHSYSWNSGVEGETVDPDVLTLRERRKRAFLATLLLSRGIPMISHGDEYGRSQQGNNNAYCQDNELSWVTWDKTPEQEAQLHFTRELIQLRKTLPKAWKETNFSVPSQQKGELTSFWFSDRGLSLTDNERNNPHSRCAGTLLIEKPCSLQELSRNDPGTLIYILFNSYWEPVKILFPRIFSSVRWRLILDSHYITFENKTEFFQERFTMKPRSMVVFIAD